ncbi:MAG TPA: pirin-like C-terminal cupin domain-containing protein [Polaromonas sp.]
MSNQIRVSDSISGHDMEIGDTFKASHFGEQDFGGLIDPVVMLDHFHMTGPTFAPHPHAGISAVTYMFEDAIGAHVNYDSLGNHGPIHPGALHWFAAGRGAVHTEQPEGKGRHVHALQIFVNLPASKKLDAPYAVHVEAGDIPEFQAPGVRVRVVTGSSNGVQAEYTTQLPAPFTLLDGFLRGAAPFTHALPRGWNAMIYVVSGKLRLEVDGEERTLARSTAAGVSVAVDAAVNEAVIRLAPDEETHFVMLSGPALNEPMVKQGPFVMNTQAQMDQVIAAYRRGELGSLDLPTEARP